jgi:hypothetical protein
MAQQVTAAPQVLEEAKEDFNTGLNSIRTISMHY